VYKPLEKICIQILTSIDIIIILEQPLNDRNSEIAGFQKTETDLPLNVQVSHIG
jgi:hypothetical protein